MKFIVGFIFIALLADKSSARDKEIFSKILIGKELRNAELLKVERLYSSHKANVEADVPQPDENEPDENEPDENEPETYSKRKPSGPKEEKDDKTAEPGPPKPKPAEPTVLNLNYEAPDGKNITYIELLQSLDPKYAGATYNLSETFKEGATSINLNFENTSPNGIDVRVFIYGNVIPDKPAQSSAAKYLDPYMLILGIIVYIMLF